MKRYYFTVTVLILLSFLMLHVNVNAQVQTAQGEQHSHDKKKSFKSLKEFISFLDKPGREKWQKPGKVIEVLRIKAGDSIADIGAGSGYFTIPFAKKAGREGNIYAIDIEQGMLDHIKKRADSENLSNIHFIRVDADETGLKENIIDLVFMCDTYHHIENKKVWKTCNS